MKAEQNLRSTKPLFLLESNGDAVEQHNSPTNHYLKESENRENNPKEWWRTAVTLQIYPRSFYDSNEDGNGDLQGIIQKMDYFKELGIDAIWLNPIHKSPWKDGGYDAASYHKVNPMFGSMMDLRELIGTAHENDIKLILDLVMNHTSDQHAWFKHTSRLKARREASNYNYENDPLANAYIIRPEDPDNPDKPPNNWQPFFGDESAWTKNPETGEWVFHKFTPEQPDLNLSNPLVRSHFKKIITRWIKTGIDGIRMDVIDHTFEDPDLADFEPNPNNKGLGHMDKWNWQKSYLRKDMAHKFAQEISETIKENKDDVLSIGEIYFDEPVSDFKYLADFYEKGRLDLPFNFSLLDANNRLGANAREYKKVIDRYMNALPSGACPNFVLGNHDQAKRLADKVGPNLKTVTMMLLTLGNSDGSKIFMYMGDELGMVKGDSINEKNMQDPQGINLGVEASRDHVRTGIVWSANQPNGGYTKNKNPWLPAGQTFDGKGYEEQRNDKYSQFTLTKNLIHLRKKLPALQFGTYVPYESRDDTVLFFGREISQGQDETPQRLLMTFNFSKESKLIPLPFKETSGTLIKSTNPDRTILQEKFEEKIQLNAHEGCIIQLNN
jgi:alpha-glucosidase